MSDNWICVIPKDPNWTPDAHQKSAVHKVLSAIMPKSDEIEFEIDDEVKFRDCGGNFESIGCPNCKSVMTTERWQILMGLDYVGGGFKMNKYKMDCCGHEASLNDLLYYFNQGFSKFIVSCMNPDRGDLSAEEIAKIEDALSTKVSVIYQHI